MEVPASAGEHDMGLMLSNNVSVYRPNELYLPGKLFNAFIKQSSLFSNDAEHITRNVVTTSGIVINSLADRFVNSNFCSKFC